MQTFANIPHLTYPNDDIVVFTMEQVRGFFFHRLYKNAIFIQGKTDEKADQRGDPSTNFV